MTDVVLALVAGFLSLLSGWVGVWWIYPALLVRHRRKRLAVCRRRIAQLERELWPASALEELGRLFPGYAVRSNGLTGPTAAIGQPVCQEQGWVYHGPLPAAGQRLYLWPHGPGVPGRR